jgi:rifampicin phosphotransferase
MKTWITDWTPSTRYPIYTRANAGEVLADPVSPLGQRLLWDLGMASGFRDGYIRFGAFAPHEISEIEPEAIGIFGGRLFINLSLSRLIGVRIPGMTAEDIDRSSFTNRPDAPPYVPHPNDESEACSAKIGETIGWMFSTQTYPELDSDRAEVLAFRAARGELAARTDAELVARALSVPALLNRVFPQHAMTGTASATVVGALNAILGGIGAPDMATIVIGAVGDVDSVLPAQTLWELSRAIRASDSLTAAFDLGSDGLSARLAEDADFSASLHDFLGAHGSRGPSEWDAYAPAWETQPELVLVALDRMRHADDDESPLRRFAASQAAREAVTAQLAENLASMPEVQGQLLGIIAAVGRWMGWRERTKVTSVLVVHELRLAVLELGRRMVANGVLADQRDLFFLLENELGPFVADPTAFAGLIDSRKSAWQQLWKIEPPFFMSGEINLETWAKVGERDSAATVLAVGDTLQGTPGAPGTARGRARVVHDVGDPGEFDAGDILIAPSTDPSWMGLFLSAAAVVCETGAQISHAVIVSRELGLPCVVSATGAMSVIPDGVVIEVNGSTGTVTII